MAELEMSERVCGFILGNKSKRSTISKKIYDVRVGVDENGETVILLFSPENRTRMRVDVYDKGVKGHTAPLSIGISKKGTQILLTIQEWEKLKQGGVITQKTDDWVRYVSLNLDNLLPFPSFGFEDWQVAALKNADIRI